MFSIDTLFKQLQSLKRQPLAPVVMIVTPDFLEYMDGFISLKTITIAGKPIASLDVRIYVSKYASCPCETFYTWEDFDLAINEINRNSKNYVR
jgi:hypothetical protein